MTECLPKNILVVDDQASTRFIVKQMLMQLGHHVVLASDGEESLRMLEAGNEIDLMITDVYMKKMSGLEVLRACHTMHPNLPVIVMSGYTREELIVEALREGACDYLAKPFEAEDLSLAITRIESLLSQRRKLGNHVDSFVINFILTSAELDIEKFQKVIKDIIQANASISTADLLNLSLVLEECLLNAQEHGNLELESSWKEDPGEHGRKSLFEQRKEELLRQPQYADRKIEIRLKIDSQKISISIRDEGKGFQTDRLTDGVCGKPFGMGLMLIRHMTDRVFFNKNGNCITFEKVLSSS